MTMKKMKMTTRRHRRKKRRPRRGRGNRSRKNISLKTWLGLKDSEKIPRSMLRTIKDAEIGTRVTLPTSKGRRSVVVQKALKQKVMAVWNTHYA